MENGDWTKFQSLMESAIKPLQSIVAELKVEIKEARTEYHQAIKDLPCGVNTVKLTQIETKIANGRQQHMDEGVIKKESKDFLCKVITLGIAATAVIVTTIGVLHAVGFFKALAK